MAITMQQFTPPSGVLTTTERDAWEYIRDRLRAPIWRWYDAHKDQKVTKIFGVYTVTIGSFGIAEAILTHVFGPRP